MTDTITLTGLVATMPKHVVTSDGLSITNFRLASTQRRYDRTQQKWIDGDTNWYTVTSFRQLATNVITSVQKGQRVLVTGRLRIRDWATDEKRGTNVEVDADAIGHDLTWGTAVFTRSTATAVAEADAAAESSAVSETAAAESDDDAFVPAGDADASERSKEAVGSVTPF